MAKQNTDSKMLLLLRRWKEIESATVKSCGVISKRTKNPIIRTLVSAISNDSVKHRSILQLIIDSMTKKAFALTPDDLADISSLLNKHIDLEREAISTARSAIEISRDPIVRQLLKMILEDEKRHAKMAEQINDMKFRITAQVT